MAAWSIANLRETPDAAPGFGFDQVQEAHFANKPLETERTGVAFHVIHPGRGGFAHRHEEAEEVYVVLAGSGRVKLDDEVHEITALDAVRVAPSVVRAFQAGPEGLQLLAFGPRHPGDGEILDGDPWAEG
jgi:mannose-6-phosphate isomerase-like protein (cupin superfamily)